MLKQKWLAVLSAAVLAAAVPLSLGASAVLAASPPPQAHVPIHYTQVSAPVGRVIPGKGSNGNGGHGGHNGNGGGTTTAGPYNPLQIQTAYNFGAYLGGSGQTIAIVDAYGDPSLTSDVAAFDSTTKFLGAAVSGNITTYYPDGHPTSTNSNWAMETALDVEWAQANAPGANIDLVIVPDSSWQHLLDGVDEAINLKQDGTNVVAISMSWGDWETNISSDTESAFETEFQNAVSEGIVLLAAAGDSGSLDGHGRFAQPAVMYPASSPEVVGVGGTTLTLSDSSGDYGSETVWSGTGGGYSSIFTESGYQTAANITGAVTPGRGVPDVAFDADPNTGVYVCYGGTWYEVGGTSVGAPNWAAIVADYAGANSVSNTLDDSYLYKNAYRTDQVHDITSGSNGVYSAATGWDPVTGIGSPNVAKLIAGSN